MAITQGPGGQEPPASEIKQKAGRRPGDRAGVARQAARPELRHDSSELDTDPDRDESRLRAGQAGSPDRAPAGPRWGRIALVGGIGVSLAIIVLAGSLWYVAQRTIDDIPTAPLDTGILAAAGADDPQNILLIGSDDRGPDNRDTAAAGKRSDTLLVIRLDPARANARVLSLPRDTRVEIPRRGTDKLNAAFAHGGPQLAIETIRGLTGIPIHHYVEINFDGLVGLVDALGGVEICVDEPMRDPKVNIWFGAVGCYQVNGAKALVFARSRTMQILRNGKWEEDGTADLGRIHRQQLLMKAILKRAVGIKSVSNWREVTDAVKKGIIIDDGLGLTQFLGLYERFGDVNADSLDTTTLPGHSSTINGVSYWIPDPVKTRPLYESFGAPPSPIGQ